MIEDDYKLSSEEKAAKKLEKIKAKKFSDAEGSDHEDGINSSTKIKKQQLSQKSKTYTKKLEQQQQQQQNPKNGKIQTSQKTSNNLNELKKEQQQNYKLRPNLLQKNLKSPEKVLIKNFNGSTSSNLTAAELLKDDKWLKAAASSAAKSYNYEIQTPPKYARGKQINDRVLTYSQPSMTNGITTLSQSSGNSMTISGMLPSSSKSGGDTIEVIFEPSKGIIVPPMPLNFRSKSRFTGLTRAEILRRCNHDTERMIGKTFLFDQVCTNGKYFNALLLSAIEGNLPKFQELFEQGFHFVKSLKSMKLLTNAQLKRKLMLNILRLFVDDGTNANLLMLLSCCKSKNYLVEIIVSCNELPHKHGYCGLLKYIGSFLRITEMRKLIGIKNFYSGRTCLNIAAIAGNLCQMKTLLEMGASLNTFDELGYSPLHYVIRKPRKDMFLEFVYCGADLSIQYPDERRPNSFQQCVMDHSTDDELQNYIFEKMGSLKALFLQRARECFNENERDVVEILSELHFSKFFIPNMRFNKIDIDFEFDLKLRCPALRHKEEVVVVIFPFEYLPEDKLSDANDPKLMFINLEKNDKYKENKSFIDLLQEPPKYVEFRTDIFDLTTFDSNSSYFNGLYVYRFKSPHRIPVSSGKLSYGKIYMETRCEEKMIDNFSNTLFGIQAYIIGPSSQHKKFEGDFDRPWMDRNHLKAPSESFHAVVDQLHGKLLLSEFDKNDNSGEPGNRLTKSGGGTPKKKKKNKMVVNEKTNTNNEPNNSKSSSSSLATLQLEMRKKKAD